MSVSKSDSKNQASETDATIELVINGEAKTLAGGCSVAGLLVVLQMANRRVAVAVNREIVVRSSYEDVQLTDGDRIEILEAVGGG